MYETRIETPIGSLVATASDVGLLSVQITVGNHSDASHLDQSTASILKSLRMQLNEYFCGDRQEFDIPLDRSEWTPWQKDVYCAVSNIPYGKTSTYRAVAEGIRPSSGHRLSRAVGQALGRNRFMIVVPCHRVVGHDGRLTGYAGGLDAKRALIELERAVA